MTYNYATASNSTLYHIVKPDRVYALCGAWVKTGKFISPEPPEGKKECRVCSKVLREQNNSTDPDQGTVDCQT